MSCRLPVALRSGSRPTIRVIACLILVALVAAALVALSDPSEGVGRLTRWAANHPLLGGGGSTSALPDPARVTAAVLQGRKEYDELGHERWNFTDRLLPDERYILSGQSEGFSNQFMGAVHTIHLALLTDRTPILPFYFGRVDRLGPLVRSHLPHMAFDAIFDLPRLFDALRTTPLGHSLRGMIDIGEILEINRDASAGGRGWPQDDGGVRSMGEVGVERLPAGGGRVDRERELVALGCWGESRVSYQNPLDRLRLRPDLTVLPPVAMQQGFWNLVPLFDGMSQVLAAHPAKGFVEKELESVPAYDKGDLAPSEWIACHDNLFHSAISVSVGMWDSWHTPSSKLNATALLEAPRTGEGALGPWESVGRYIHWHPTVAARGQEVVRRLFGLDERAPIPHFISVHIRHGDFLPRCQANPDKTCFSLPAFAHEVANMRKRLLDERGIADAQVIFTTNERDKGFLEAARKLGWKRITDEEELRMRHEYGDWYPMLMDNVLLSMGTAVIGTAESTMSMLNARRAEYWHDGFVSYLGEDAPES